MAKTLDKKQLSAFDDDFIKEALKTGLESISPSDDIIEKTLSECRDGILSKDTRKARLSPLIYKIGAPVAACLAVLILALNLNPSLVNDRGLKGSTAQVAQSAAAAGGSGEEVSQDQSIMSERVTDYDIAGEQPVEAPVPSAKDNSSLEFGKSSETRPFLAAIPARLMLSYVHRSNNIDKADKAGYADAFKYIVDRYNDSNGTNYSLDQDGVTPIHSLPETGVNADMLLEAKSYRDILSGEGYWALPLKDSDGNYKGFLSAVSLEQASPDMAVSNQDTTVDFEGGKFLASFMGDTSGDKYVASLFESLFDGEKIVFMVREAGYDNVSSEPVIADINNGIDFLAFIEADDQELAVPFIVSHDYAAIENNKVYTREELFSALSESLK